MAEAGGAEAPVAAEESGAGGGGDMADPQQQVGLRAGSVDDNERFEAYLDYRAQLEALGIAGRPFDPAGRLVVTVVGSDGRPLLGAHVRLGDESDATTTGADGQALLFRHAAGRHRRRAGRRRRPGQQQGTDGPDPPIPVPSAGRRRRRDAGPARRGGRRADTSRPSGRPQRRRRRRRSVPLDIDFIIDATGSMDDEIERLREEMIRVARASPASTPTPTCASR